ncbi:MAG: peptidoglycan DD-metalloendopeptidase family protein [Candidatus Nealsonbacteria bacterium]|nr:peptidoglycan DD-metalloendopeptidase family protein [Candidatus Nealsonbacteria bacterium]
MGKKRKILTELSLSLLLFFGISLPVFALEVDYPKLGGQNPGETITTYVRYIFILFVSLTGFIAVSVLAIGAVEYMTSVGDVGKMKNAKSKIFSSSLGILLLLSSYLILYTINPNLTKLEEPTIAQLASGPLPKTPISTVPTADLLTRIKILAEDTEEIPDIIYNSARLISGITKDCDCQNTKPMCSCETVLSCPQTPWYTVYSHMDKIYLKANDEVEKGDVIGEVGKKGTDIPPHLHFQVGFRPSPGDSVSSINITSKISAPGGIKGSLPEGAKEEPLPKSISQEDIKYILTTLKAPLEYDQCVWYEIKDPLHTGNKYWAENWKCLSDDITESAKVHVMSGNLNNSGPPEGYSGSPGEVKSTVENVDESTGTVIIKHLCPTPTPTPTPTPSPVSFNDAKKEANSSGISGIKSLGSIESLGDITCDSGRVHYFYNNFQNEGCCHTLGMAATESLCGPNGNQLCCPSATSKCSSSGTAPVCCPNANACGFSYGAVDCCSPEKPLCTNTYFPSLPSPYKGVCCPANNKVCYNGAKPEKGTTCCSSVDTCIEGTASFSCCDTNVNVAHTSIACGNPKTLCCTDPDKDATPGVGTTNVSCGGTNSNPTCIVETIFKCNAGETAYGDKGYQVCCTTGLGTTYTFLDKDKNEYHNKGTCRPPGKDKICFEANSDLPPVWCSSSESCIKSTTGFECCNTATSKIFGSSGFQKCCLDGDGNSVEGAGDWSVIDIGTWNNPICMNVPNTPPFSCTSGTTICGSIPGKPTCCSTSDQCITIGDYPDYYFLKKGYCCPSGRKFCYTTETLAVEKQPACCAEGENECIVTTTNDNKCCNTDTSTICSYTAWGIWGFLMGQKCCLGPENDPTRVLCAGDWLNPLCVQVEIPPPPFDIPPVDGEKCQRIYTSMIYSLRSSGWMGAQSGSIIDQCCDKAEYACFNYKNIINKNGETGFCCEEGQQCINNSSGADCSCPSDHRICGSPILGNQVCCESNQLCGGTPTQAQCLNPLAPILPSPIPCSISETACSGGAGSGLSLPVSETQTCCSSGTTCYLEDKNGTPFHPLEYTWSFPFAGDLLKNSIGKCCPSNKTAFTPTLLALTNTGAWTVRAYGVCCDTNVDIIVDKYGLPSCCNQGEKGCGTLKEGAYVNGFCCKSDEKCSNNKCVKPPTYCESPAPSPLNSVPPAPCSCSPTPTPAPETSPVGLKCTDQTCFAGEKYHPCGETGGKELLYWQNKLINKKDVIIYYKNRLVAERKDLETDVNKYVKPTLEWFGREIQRQYEQLSGNSPTPKSTTEKQIEFLKERMGWLEEEQEYKEELLKKMEDAEKILDQYEFISNNVSQLPDKCLSNVKSACDAVCTKEGQTPDVLFKGEDGQDNLGNYGCHNAFWGCKPISCEGGNPCPAVEIDAEVEKLNALTPDVKSAYDEIIYLILTIKKERVPKITF